MDELRYEFVPANTDSGQHVGSYRRRLPVNLVRMYENALDWEHLPHLHGVSFSALELLDAGAWGWRAKWSISGRAATVSLNCVWTDQPAAG